MEAIGGIASLLTLVNAACKTAKCIHSLVENYHNAPTEITALKDRLSLLNTNLHILRRIQATISNDNKDLNLAFEDREILRQSLLITEGILHDIHEYLLSRTTKVGRLSRFRWAIHDISKVKIWEKRLKWHTDLLQNTMGLLGNLNAALVHREVIALKDEICFQGSLGSRERARKVLRFSWAEAVFGSDWVLPQVARLNGSICCTEDTAEEQRFYRVSLRLFALFCLRTFSIEFRLHHASLFSVRICTIDAGVALKNVVPDDSKMMVACRNGDTPTVLNLLHERKAGVNDITSNNLTPFSFATTTGSEDLLDLLTARGADSSKSFGHFQTSPLARAMAHRQLSVCRWLVRHRVDVHHVSALGWTPIFSLYGSEKWHQESCDEYLDILVSDSFSYFDAQDGSGVTAMHRAAAFGTGEHVVSLIARGALANIRTKTGWTPIFSAVQSGNLSTLKELTRHQPDFLTITDFRSWSLLHVAAAASQLEVMSYLIGLGANPFTVTPPSESIEDIDLRGKSLTPGDIAYKRGIFSVYSRACKREDGGIRVCCEGGEIEVFYDCI